MSDQLPEKTLTRRTLLATAGKATVVAIAAPLVDLAAGGDTALAAQAIPADLNAVAGPDRVVMKHGQDLPERVGGLRQPPRRDRRRATPPAGGTPAPPRAPPRRPVSLEQGARALAP